MRHYISCRSIWYNTGTLYHALSSPWLKRGASRADSVIHCLGPVYGRDNPSAELLASCYRNALKLAEEHGIASIAFPAISTGVFGYPKDEAAAVALKTVIAELPRLASVKQIRFVLYGADDLEIYERAMEEWAQQ